MYTIENYNCDGLCIHEFCGQRYTHYVKKKIFGVDVVLAFCENHANEFEEKFLDFINKLREESIKRDFS